MVDRRTFLSSLAALPAALRRQFPSGALRHPDRILLEDGRPLLAVIRGSDVRSMIDAAFARLPALRAALAGRRVVIKPNATASELYPVTSDAEMLRALVRQVRQARAAAITICDSSSFAGLANARVFSRLGYAAMAKEENVRAVAIDSQVGSEYVRVANPNWKRNRFVMTDRIVNRADFVISVAVPKRHHVADFSCALKNNFGCTYGTSRMVAHAQGEEFFDDALVEFADAVRPDLTIIDARLLLARYGPAFREGESEIVPGGVMVIAGDMVAADAWCGRLMEENDRTFDRSRRLDRQLDYARRLGLGEPDLRKAEIIEVEG